jgi:hypothetical protein
MTSLEIADGSSSATPKASAIDQLWLFFAKVLIGSVTLTVVSYIGIQLAIWSITSSIEEKYPVVRGGPAFWREVEVSLLAFANQPDMDEAKKKKVVEALRKLSKKYQPFIEALTEK